MGILLVTLTIGLGVILVGIPSFTRHVSVWFDSPELTGLDKETAEETAELVRAYVMGDESEPLPERVSDREGFDEKTVSHLDDVRVVISRVRGAAGVAAAVLAAWVAWSLVKGRTAAIIRGLKAGAIVTGVATILVVLAAALDFDAVFTVFHGLFFVSGTWTFTSDSLIIQLFPTPFWAAAGGALALWVLLCVALMLWGARSVGRSAATGGMTRG